MACRHASVLLGLTYMVLPPPSRQQGLNVPMVFVRTQPGRIITKQPSIVPLHSFNSPARGLPELLISGWGRRRCSPSCHRRKSFGDLFPHNAERQAMTQQFVVFGQPLAGTYVPSFSFSTTMVSQPFIDYSGSYILYFHKKVP